jgi:hypothetical protein
MWFDVRRLIASANFQDDLEGDVPSEAGLGGGGLTSTAPIDPGLAETPAAAPGGMTAGGDPLSPGAAPPGVTGSWADMPGATLSDAMGPYGADMGDTGTAGGGDYSTTAAQIAGASPGPSLSTDTTATPTTPAPSATPGSQGKGVDQSSTETDYVRPGTAGGAGGGAAGANAVQGFANSLNGLARAAQAGNPQAAQLMNMIRQMMMQQQMQQQMGGMGQQYNPYMNQMFNPWMNARMRMEMMRRRNLERQILAGQRGAHSAPAAGPGTFGGGRRGR